MALACESEFIFIGKGDESFLENYSYELTDDPTAKGGRIFMALEILNNQSEAEDIGEALFSNFRQAFYRSMEADPYERFEESLKEVNATIESFRQEKASRFIGNLNISIGAIVENTLYISVTGDAEAYLIRKRFVSIISEGLVEDAHTESFVNIANGALEEGDTVLLSSSRLVRYITKGDLGKMFALTHHGELAEALGELQDYLLTEILGRSAVVGLYMGKEEAVAADIEGMFDSELMESGERSAWHPVEAWRRFSGSCKSLYRKFRMISFVAKIPGVKTLVAWGANLWMRNKINTVKDKVSETLESTAAAAQEKMGRVLPKIRFRKEMRKERILMIAAGLLILLVVSVFWLRSRGGQQELIAEHQSRLNHVRELLGEASTVGQFDKEKAADTLTAAEQEALTVLSSRFLRSEAVTLLDEIQTQRDTLDDIKRLTPTIVANLAEKRENVSALGLIALKDLLYAFEYNALYEIVLDKLQDPLTISDVETVILASAFNEENSLLFLTRTGKMLEYKDGRVQEVSTSDGLWKKGVDMTSYGPRLYVLDPEHNQIWRYQRRREGFDVSEAYNQDASLEKGVSIAIDSNIYVLNSDGTITQLYQGEQQEFPLRRSPVVPVTQPTKLVTAPESLYLYVLEPAQQRVLIYRKDLQNGGAAYQTQYVFENVGTLRDLEVVDNRLYIADDKQVYFVNLRGLPVE